VIPPNKVRAVLMAITGWSGRLFAIGVFLLWGTFFLEHLEWFVRPGRGWPPPHVGLLQLAHLIMLIGLLVLLRWEVLGGVITLMASLVFFGFVAGNRFPLFVASTALPVVLVLTARFLRPAGSPQ
jgi:hypothetical protein